MQEGRLPMHLSFTFFSGKHHSWPNQPNPSSSRPRVPQHLVVMMLFSFLLSLSNWFLFQVFFNLKSPTNSGLIYIILARGTFTQNSKKSLWGFLFFRQSLLSRKKLSAGHWIAPIEYQSLAVQGFKLIQSWLINDNWAFKTLVTFHEILVYRDPYNSLWNIPCVTG